MNLTKHARFFSKNGEPFFFLADTAWMSFLKLTLEEFEEYVSFRAGQGFNSMLIMTTPAISDSSDNIRWFPFGIREDGSIDFSKINEEFFEIARAKLKILQKYGIVPFITLVWGCYFKGSSLEEFYEFEGKQFTNTKDFEEFVNYAVESYKEFHPVWLVGGDVALEGAVAQHYLYMAKRIRSVCPDDIMGLHINIESHIPPEFYENRLIDFYSFQSGHVFNSEDEAKRPAVLARKYYDLEPKLPVINLEPMYEAHGFGNRFGRFDEFYIRRAFWYSVLNGANAGFTYGAHGVWMFFDKGDSFNNEYWSKQPLFWRNALKLPGGFDTVYNKDLFKQFDMFRLQPLPSLNLTQYDEIVTAADENKTLLVAYVPFTNYLILDADLSQYDCKWYLLGNDRKVLEPEIWSTTGKDLADKFARASKGQARPILLSPEAAAKDCISFVEMHQFNCDGLLICTKKQVKTTGI